MSVEQRVARGQQAEAALKFLDDVFVGLRTVTVEAIETASPNDPANILEMHRSLQNLAKVRDAIGRVVRDGDYARRAIAAAQMNRN